MRDHADFAPLPSLPVLAQYQGSNQAAVLSAFQAGSAGVFAETLPARMLHALSLRKGGRHADFAPLPSLPVLVQYQGSNEATVLSAFQTCPLELKPEAVRESCDGRMQPYSYAACTECDSMYEGHEDYAPCPVLAQYQCSNQVAKVGALQAFCLSQSTAFTTCPCRCSLHGKHGSLSPVTDMLCVQSGLPGYDAMLVLHGKEFVELHAPLPAAGSLDIQPRSPIHSSSEKH